MKLLSPLPSYIARLLPKAIRDRYRAIWYRFLMEVQWHARVGMHGRRLPGSCRGGKRIHLGCGHVNIHGFINVDAAPHPHVHYRCRLDDLSPIPTGCAVLVYACHCLEHFPREQVGKVLAEWVRVLEPGGTLRIAVPDFDAIIKLYHMKNDNISAIQSVLMGGQDYLLNFHFTVFNEKSLRSALEASGLRHVKQWQPGIDKWSVLNDGASACATIGHRSLPLSLNLEAVKQ